MRTNPDRLETLRQLMLLDSQPQREYDAIAERVAEVLQVPIAMVNLLDERRDWFKACVGLPLQESPASTSFCEAMFDSAHDLVVVEDTTADERFKAHPLVTGAPFVRFYAAARLALGGQTVGTLCAYDLSPRRMAREQLEEVRHLAAAVVGLMLARQSAAAQGQA
jgi:GAF domain-containing protein